MANLGGAVTGISRVREIDFVRRGGASGKQDDVMTMMATMMKKVAAYGRRRML